METRCVKIKKRCQNRNKIYVRMETRDFKTELTSAEPGHAPGATSVLIIIITSRYTRWREIISASDLYEI